MSLLSSFVGSAALGATQTTFGPVVYPQNATSANDGPGVIVAASTIGNPPTVKVHTTGPVFHFIETPGGPSAAASADPNTSTVYFLGTSEFTPRVRFNTYHSAIRLNQMYGSKVPGDQAFEGKSAQIYTELNIYSEKVLQMLEAAPRQGFSTSRAFSGGRYAATDVGAMLIGDRCYFGLHLIFSTAAKVVPQPGALNRNAAGAVGSGFVAAGAQPAIDSWTEDQAFNFGTTPVGYRFLYCKMLTQYSTAGSGQELKRMLIIDAMAARRQQIYGTAGPNGNNQHYLELYDHKVLSASQLLNQVLWNNYNDFTNAVGTYIKKGV